MSVPAADNLRQWKYHDPHDPLDDAADLLEAIDALPDDGPMSKALDLSEYGVGHCDGWRDAMTAVRRLLHPEVQP